MPEHILAGLARRLAAPLLALSLSVAVFSGPALAHHGWGWTEDAWFELSGTLTEIYVGNPHATLTIEAEDGTLWDVDLAPLFRTLNAGFEQDIAAPGDPVTVIGHRSIDPGETHMKAVRVIHGGINYDVYPARAAGYDNR
ncbi:DUF6152 family protein [Cucumibacter marinus]|uniref:DUF6152 family protein n=1 Tax=Cucumibacter marinus TaxID=1121252 RepID=UPI000404D4E0|nr:DUF6152 family protein [Cucumibacter marinus]